MLSKLSDYFYAKANGKTLGVAFAVYLLFTFFVLMPANSRWINHYGTALKPLDFDFPCDASVVSKTLETLGESGRSEYGTFVFTGDFVYPIVYSVGLVLLLSYLFIENVSRRKAFRYFNLLPLLAAIVDYIENSFIYYLLHSFPVINENTVFTGCVFSKLKWILVFMCFVLIAIGFLRMLWRKMV